MDILNIRSKWLFSIVIIISVTVSSCSLVSLGVSKTKFTEEKGAIPPEFGKNEETLMIQLTGDPKFEKYITKIAAHRYKEDYLILYPKEIKAKKYKDLDIFRYIFTYEKGNDHVEQGTGKVRFTTKQFYIFDRKNNKKYIKDFSTSYWGMMCRAYLKNLSKKKKSWSK